MTPLNRNRLSRVAGVAALALAFLSSPARADAPAAPTATAEQLAEQAYQQHASGKEAEAIATYLRAYELSHAAAILFNVATIYDRKLRERGLAEDFYRRYLGAPDAEPELTRKATERLTSLKKEDEDEAEAKRAAVVVAPVPTTTPPAIAPQSEPPAASVVQPAPAAVASPASNGHTVRTVGIVVGALGVAGVGASMVLGVLAKAKNDDANAVCNGATCANENGVMLANQAGSLASASTVTFVAGLALVGGGITTYLLAPKDPASPMARIRITPEVGLDRAGVSIGGSF
jgi:hypothetical protein